MWSLIQIFIKTMYKYKLNWILVQTLWTRSFNNHLHYSKWSLDKLLPLEQLISLMYMQVIKFIHNPICFNANGSQCLYKDPIHLVLILCLYKDLNQWSNLYKEHVNLYTYQNFMSYQNFTSIVISYSPFNNKFFFVMICLNNKVSRIFSHYFGI